MNDSLPNIFGDVSFGIIKALAYADVFDFPLTPDEIYLYFIGSFPVERPLINEALAALRTQGRVGERGGYYFLPGRENIVPLRLSCLAPSLKNWKKVGRFTYLFRFLPWLKLVGVSGALAMGNSGGDDDIDLVFITDLRRVWLTRLFVVGLLKLSGQYRSARRIKGRFCPNLFLSTAGMTFTPDLFIAHEIVQMRPVLARNGIYEKFLAANSWLYGYLPNTKKFPEEKENIKRDLFPQIFDGLEELARRFQLKYMEKKKTIETTTLAVIALHPRATKDQVLAAYESRLTSLNIERTTAS
ncbi:MAG: hypothetical protein AAB486_04290 [Patescibacteria group bacterium]